MTSQLSKRFRVLAPLLALLCLFLLACCASALARALDHPAPAGAAPADGSAAELPMTRYTAYLRGTNGFFQPDRALSRVKAAQIPGTLRGAADEGGRYITTELPTTRHTAYLRGTNDFFHPDRALSRAEAAQILWTLRGVADAPVEAAFSDVQPGDWFAPAVLGMADLLPGYEDGSFQPGRSVTLLEFAHAALRTVDPASAALSDEAALSRLQAPDGLEGGDSITRGEAVALLDRLLGRKPDTHAIDALDAVVFVDVPETHPYYYDILEAALPHLYYARSESEVWDEEGLDDAALDAGVYCDKGMAYLVLPDGTRSTQAGILDYGGARYLADADGRIFADGALHLVDGQVVFCTPDGSLLRDGSWGQYRFDQDGCYTTGDAALDGYVQEAIAACTTKEMTQRERLRACFDYVRAFSYLGRNAALPDTVRLLPLENAVGYATKIFETGKGDCYNFAASFCFLARALGYEANVIIGTCSYSWSSVPIAHGWVELTMDGQIYLFDPQIENYNLRQGISNESYGAFGVTYETASGVYYQNRGKGA